MRVIRLICACSLVISGYFPLVAHLAQVKDNVVIILHVLLHNRLVTGLAIDGVCPVNLLILVLALTVNRGNHVLVDNFGLPALLKTVKHGGVFLNRDLLIGKLLVILL